MKKILIVVALAVMAGVVFFLASAQEAIGRAAWQGKAVQAVPGSVTVLAEFEMDLKSEIGGRVLQSELDAGASFKEGAILVQIDSSDLKLEIERIRGEYEAAKERIAVGSSIALDLASAREDLAASERLMRSGNMSEAVYRKQEREMQQIEKKLELEEVNNELLIANFENTLAQKQRELEKMQVTAPFECVVSEVYARPGDLIGGGAPIALLISTSRTVEARISEENFSNIRVGQKASLRLLGYGNEQFNATVAKVLPTADEETQRYNVHLEVDIELEKLVPGLTGEVSIVTAERSGTVIIPRRALIGDKVMVIADGRVEVRSVTSGYESLNEVEIVEGLEVGEFVITEELDLYRDGDRVTPVERS
jgi:RND family efflux transporter MFP subunit